MKVYQAMFVSLVAISVIGDVGHFFQTLSASPGSELSRNSFSLISGADAWVGLAARAIGRAVKSAAGHTKNKRPSNKGKHEKGDARRQRDQNRSDGQKGGKGGSKKRGGRSSSG
ncbi:hypothetical protein SNE40_007546 [Patella caerulea]|uniref:Uncharacterized protein n=1 Tax=Patella caerulea TaxID=87958 RepID=A0AAN8PV57_PATCE